MLSSSVFILTYIHTKIHTHKLKRKCTYQLLQLSVFEIWVPEENDSKYRPPMLLPQLQLNCSFRNHRICMRLSDHWEQSCARLTLSIKIIQNWNFHLSFQSSSIKLWRGKSVSPELELFHWEHTKYKKQRKCLTLASSHTQICGLGLNPHPCPWDELLLEGRNVHTTLSSKQIEILQYCSDTGSILELFPIN